jgi:hypothetical protein
MLAAVLLALFIVPQPRCVEILPTCAQGCYLPATPAQHSCLKTAKDAGAVHECRSPKVGFCR